MAEGEKPPSIDSTNNYPRYSRDTQNYHGDPNIKTWLAGRGQLEKIEKDNLTPADVVRFAAETFWEMLSSRFKHKGTTDSATSSPKRP